MTTSNSSAANRFIAKNTANDTQNCSQFTVYITFDNEGTYGDTGVTARQYPEYWHGSSFHVRHHRAISNLTVSVQSCVQLTAVI